MVQMAQVQQPEQKYVTDGTHVYPFNEYLVELVVRGELKYCEYPIEPPSPKARVAVAKDDPLMDTVQKQLFGGMETLNEPEAA